MGGALAVIAAARMRRSDVDVYTFGCPRISDRTYRSNIMCLDRIYRFVYNRDVITRLPFLILGYVHSGNETIFNTKGEVITWQRTFFILWLVFI